MSLGLLYFVFTDRTLEQELSQYCVGCEKVDEAFSR